MNASEVLSLYNSDPARLSRAMLWQDVPVRGIAGWMGRPFRRVTDAVVPSTYDGRPHVEVEYLSDGKGFTVGDLGLICAADKVEHVGYVSCSCPECCDGREWRALYLGLRRLCTPFYCVDWYGNEVGRYATFDEALIRVVRGAEWRRSAGYRITNVDRCDEDGPGLTEEEEEQMREALL